MYDRNVIHSITCIMYDRNVIHSITCIMYDRNVIHKFFCVPCTWLMVLPALRHFLHVDLFN